MSKELRDPIHPELDRTDLGQEYLRLVLEADTENIFRDQLEALPMHDDEDQTYIATFPRRNPEEIEKNILPAQYIAFIPVRIAELAKAITGIGRDKFHVVGKGMLIEDDGESTNQAHYMASLKGIPEIARELWNKSLQTTFIK